MKAFTISSVALIVYAPFVISYRFSIEHGQEHHLDVGKQLAVLFQRVVRSDGLIALLASRDGCDRSWEMLPCSSNLKGILLCLRNKFLSKAVQRSQIGCTRQVHNNLLYAQSFQIGDALTNRRGTTNQGGISEFWFVDIRN